MWTRYLVLATAIVFSSGADAQRASSGVEVLLDIATDRPPASRDGVGALSFSDSLAAYGGNAYGFGDLRSGTLRASVIAPPRLPGVSVSAAAVVELFDSIVFAAGASGRARLNYSFDGVISPYNGGSVASGGSYYVSVDGIVNRGYLINAPCIEGDPNACISGTAPRVSGSIDFQIHPGIISFLVDLGASAFDGGYSDFSNTGRLFLELPVSATYTSASGHFLESALPITLPVPEPGTFFLMGAGLCLLAAGRRQRLFALLR